MIIMWLSAQFIPEEESLLLHLYLEFTRVRPPETPLWVLLLAGFETTPPTTGDKAEGVVLCIGVRCRDPLAVGSLSMSVVVNGEAIKVLGSLLCRWLVDTLHLNWDLFNGCCLATWELHAVVRKVQSRSRSCYEVVDILTGFITHIIPTAGCCSKLV